MKQPQDSSKFSVTSETATSAGSAAASATHLQATPPRILLGIDWADGEHTYALLDPHGKLHRDTVAQTPEALAELLAHWQQRHPLAPVEVCVETSRGPLINALLEHPQVRIYPVNPNGCYSSSPR